MTKIQFFSSFSILMHGIETKSDGISFVIRIGVVYFLLVLSRFAFTFFFFSFWTWRREKKTLENLILFPCTCFRDNNEVSRFCEKMTQRKTKCYVRSEESVLLLFGDFDDYFFFLLLFSNDFSVLNLFRCLCVLIVASQIRPLSHGVRFNSLSTIWLLLLFLLYLYKQKKK